VTSDNLTRGFRQFQRSRSRWKRHRWIAWG
jgi:hypothetical protein